MLTSALPTTLPTSLAMPGLARSFSGSKRRHTSAPQRMQTTSTDLPHFVCGKVGRPMLRFEPPPAFRSSSGFRSISEPASIETKVVYRSLPWEIMGKIDEKRSRSVPLETVVIPRSLPPVWERATSFSSGQTAEEIFKALVGALSKYDITPKPRKGKVKGNAVVLGNAISFQVHIFSKPGKNGDHLVEFQRRSGDSCGFWYLFREAMENLSSDLADAAAYVKNRGDTVQYQTYKKVWKSLDNGASQKVANMLADLVLSSPTPLATSS
ncbi:hypothetical protein AAMO2058_001179600 [Amorphochlora amoebiformis]|eukprot:1394873-Amorphochlora_amoeboformis.AAC.2